MNSDEETPQYSKEVAKGSFWNLAGNMAFKLTSFLYIILIARAASQDDVGLFSLALAVVSLVSIFSDLGLAGALQRYVPYFEARNEKGKIKDLLKLSYIISTAVAFILMALLWWQADLAGTIYQNGALPEAIRFLVAYLILSNLLRISTSALQGFADMRSTQYISNMQNGLKLVLTAVLFYLYGATVITMSAAFLLSNIPAVIAAIISVWRRTAGFPSRGGTSIAPHQLFGEIAPFGIMLNIVTLFWSMTAYADRLLLGYLTSPAISTEIVAIYTVAVTMSAVLLVFPGSVVGIFLPVMSRLVGKNEPAHIRHILDTSQRWSMLITLPLGLVMMIFASDMLGAFYGQAYANGGLVMAVFTFGLLIQSLSIMLLYALAALRLVRLELRIAFITMIVNIILNAILIPIYGMEGSAIASLISCLAITLLLAYYGNKLFSFILPSGAHKILLAAVAAFVIVLAVKPVASSLAPLLPSIGGGALQPYANKVIYLAYLGVLGAITAALFFFFAFIMKCFKNEDVLIMKKALQRAGAPHGLVSITMKTASFGVGSPK